MQEREAFVLMESKELTRLAVSRQQNSSGWIINIYTTHNNNGDQTLVTKRGKTNRIFKTSDAALRWCKKIGFDEVTVHL
jgi:hypothetical protein